MIKVLGGGYAVEIQPSFTMTAIGFGGARGLLH